MGEVYKAHDPKRIRFESDLRAFAPPTDGKQAATVNAR